MPLANGSRIVLPLASNVCPNNLSAKMREDLQPRLLLFLRRLRRLELADAQNYRMIMDKVRVIESHFADSQERPVQCISKSSQIEILRLDTAIRDTRSETKKCSTVNPPLSFSEISDTESDTSAAKTVYVRESERWFVFTQRLEPPRGRLNADADLKIAFPYPDIEKALDTVENKSMLFESTVNGDSSSKFDEAANSHAETVEGTVLS